MKNGLIIAVVALVLLAGGIMALVKNDKAEAPVTKKQMTATKDQTTTKSSSQSGTITYSNGGFSPQTLTVNRGDIIAVKNDSSRTIQFDSDPHPSHTDNTKLNVDTIRPGQSKSFTADRTGTFGYHDHLDPSQTGEIIVK